MASSKFTLFALLLIISFVVLWNADKGRIKNVYTKQLFFIIKHILNFK